MSVRNWLEPMREVCTLHSGRIAIHGNSIVASGGSTPTIVAVPRIARLSTACRTSVGVADRLEGVVDAARRRSARGPPSTGSSCVASTKCVAPTRFAISSLRLELSTAMICGAPPMRAPWTIDSPTRRSRTPPRSARPAARGAERRAHAGEHAAARPAPRRSSGRSASIFTSEFSCRSMRSA